MTIAVTHSTPADGTFSSTGATAWNANHTLSGVGTMAEQDANAVAITGGTAALTEVDIPTNSGTSTVTKGTGITSWLYSGNSFSIAGQEATPAGLFIGSAGTKMYVNGASGDDVNEYTLSTAWDITTATFVTVFSTSAQDSAPNDIFFKPDGLSMFIMGNTTDTVYQYTLSTAWDVSTASYASKSFSVTTQEATPTGLWFKSDGTIMYVIGTTADTVFQYALSTAWDVSTASYGSIFFSVASQEGTPQQVNLSADGLKMWVLGQAGDDIWEYNLGTAWNVSTATLVNNFYVGFQDTSPSGMFIDSSAVNRVYIVGQLNDTVFQYNTSTNSLEIDTEKLYIDGALSVNRNFVAGENAYVDGALTVQGNISSSGSTSLSTTSVGGTLTATSAVSLGTGTAAVTHTLGSGATISGSLKTINIGTSGVSGSTTAINIGSAVSGSLGTTTIQAPTVNIGQTATQFAVTNTASAVNYIQVTGAATGGNVALSAQGSDTNIGMTFATKGSFGMQFNNASGGSIVQYTQNGTVSATTNFLRFTNFNGSGGAPAISAQGTDTNIPLVLQPKGTGALQAQQTDSTATGGNARGANAVDWQTSRSAASQVTSGQFATISGGTGNTANSYAATIAGGNSSSAGNWSFVGGGFSNASSGNNSIAVGGYGNTSGGYLNFVGGGFTNSGTSASAVTTQSGTMNGTTAVTLSGSNASIKVGQLITGTSINTFPYTYVAAISGTSLTLSQAASGSSTSTLSFFTPHGVVVGGGNNQATGSYSFIGGGGDAGTAANRNVASGDWSTVAGGWKNTASGLFSGALSGTNNIASGVGAVVCGGGTFGGVTQVSGNTASGLASFVGAGFDNQASSNATFIGAGKGNRASGLYSAVFAGSDGTTRGIWGNHIIPALNPFSGTGTSQSATLVIGKQTTDATATVLTVDGGAAGTTNQVILPNNSAYYFKGTVVAGVTGGGNTKGWTVEGVIKRGANAASTALVGTPTVTSSYADAGASTWALTATADTTNGGLAITFTGQAATTIRCVAKIETTEMTY
jgi:hypothetical protein